MRIAFLAVALGAAACAPTISPQDVANRPQGLTKTARATMTPYFTATGTPRVAYDIGSGPVSQVATNVNGVWSAEMPGSEALPQGTPVDLEWSVTYTPLLLPAPGSVSEQQTFTVGAPPRVQIEQNQICMRQGELTTVGLNLQPGGLSAQVSLEVTPASLALPQVATVTVSSPQGNAVNVEGEQVGTGELRASAANYEPDEAAVRVIEPLSTANLVAPQNGASNVFFGNQPFPNASTVAVQLEWSPVPGSIGGSQRYRVHWREDNGAWTFTNSSVEDIVLSFQPGTEVSWKIQALFNNCPSGTGYGPESEVRTFTVWAPPQS